MMIMGIFIVWGAAVAAVIMFRAHADHKEENLKGSVIEQRGVRILLEEKTENAIFVSLDALAGKNPDLFWVAEHCRKQITAINERQERLSELMSLNRADYLFGVYDELGTVKAEIMQNISDILTLCIAAGAQDGGVLYGQLNAEEIEREFESNQIKLDKTDELLQKCAVAVNQHDTSKTNISIDAWIKVIDEMSAQDEGGDSDERVNID